MKKGFLKLLGATALLCLSHSSMAAVLDFTDNSLINSLSSTTNGYSGTFGGIGFTITSSDGTVNFSEGYDGGLRTGCGTVLICDKDGSGITNDEITQGQKLTLTFDSAVKISGLYFLDMYKGTGTEQAQVTFDGSLVKTVSGTELSGQGGYAALTMTPVFAKMLEITAPTQLDLFKDDSNNDFALAGVNVSAVPVPAAVFLFAPALLGFMGLRRKSNKNLSA